ncbi:peptidoglycan DD-metalloendopeptidase family protein [Candidatus Avelusimicrobium facis]|uniref:peptidoglycan DD-metalloendopeptidase family protein n=1 Tax=Candidatus Avelusimicrobium facis TaxID=3416203 RepID=UPI0015B5BDC2
MYQKLIAFFNRHYRRYHDVLFYVLTLAVIVLTTGLAITITRDKNEQELINSREKEILVSQFTIKQKPIYVALQEAGLDNRQVSAIVDKLSSVANTRKLQSKDTYSISTTTDGRFAMLLLNQGLTRYFVADAGGQLVAGVSDVEIQTRVRSAAGKIEGSLFNSMLQDGITVPLVVDLTDAFSWNIDFNTETRNGDEFAAVWEEHYTQDGTITGQDLVAALYKGQVTGENYAFYYNDEFFDESGKISKKMFLKSPISFRGVRITSRFNPKRMHPILRIRRPHLGIDYAAPTGTPVQAVADGVVTFVGRKGGFGNYVEIRHTNNYVTSYGHLYRYAGKTKKGAKVKQGDTIAYVGSTGLSTGPHLDFRIKEGNKFVDFLKMKNRNSALRSIPKEQRKDFEELKTLYLKALNEARAQEQTQAPAAEKAEEQL